MSEPLAERGWTPGGLMLYGLLTIVTFPRQYWRREDL